MNAKHVLALACTLACSTAGLAGTTTAAEAPGSSPFYPLNAEQAREVDILGIAQALDIAPEAARSRLNVQRHAGAIAKRIRTQYASRLAGIYIEHEPRHRLVVRLTGHDAVRPEFHQFGADPLEVAFVLGADRSFAQSQRLFDARFAKLIQRVPGIQGGYVDERTGEIVVELVRDAKAGRLADTRRVIADHFGLPTRVQVLDEPLVNQVVRGSGALDFTQSSTSAECTGAFTVKRTVGMTTTYGLLTAGHCQPDGGSFGYTEAAGATTHTLSYVARKFDADSDISWASISTNPSDVSSSFYANAWRDLGGSVEKDELTVNDQLCRYGRNGLYGCGTVQSTSYNPGNTCGPGVTIGSGTSACSSTYVEMLTASGLCLPGDSGGPWFAGTYAVGVHKAGSSTQCVFTSIDDIASLGLLLF